MEHDERAELLYTICGSEIATLLQKDKHYGGSWKKRGGVGAFMMMARKWDRIEQMSKSTDYDIFRALTDFSENKGDLMDDLRDLRSYILLIIEHMEHGKLDLQKMINEEGDLWLAMADTKKDEVGIEQEELPLENQIPTDALNDPGVRDIKHQYAEMPVNTVFHKSFYELLPPSIKVECVVEAGGFARKIGNQKIAARIIFLQYIHTLICDLMCTDEYQDMDGTVEKNSLEHKVREYNMFADNELDKDKPREDKPND